MKRDLTKRLDEVEGKLEGSRVIEPDRYDENRRRIWQEIKSDRERFGAYVSRLDETMTPDVQARLGTLSDKEQGYAFWLLEQICKAHHCTGAPLELPLSVLEAFLARPEIVLSEGAGYDGIVRGYKQGACCSCGYGLPYRFWGLPPKDGVIYQGYAYDYLMRACPLCGAAIEDGKSYSMVHGRHPHGERTERKPLLLRPLEKCVADGTRPSDYGVVMPEGWPDR